MKNKINLAFIGLGWWSNMLADAALKSKNINIYSCYSRSIDKQKAFTEKYGGIARDSYDDIISDKNVDGIIITTPNSTHAEIAIKAASFGKHIYVEKPMALNVDDCQKMIRAADNANVILMVGHNARRMARYRKAKELIDNGYIGRIILVEASSTGELGMKLNPNIWRWYRSESPGGPLTSFTVHHADNFNYLIGPVKKLSAYVSKICGPAEADDVVSSITEFENGALGYLGGSFITPDRNTMQIHGTDGVVLIDEEGGSTYYQKKGTEIMIKFPLTDSSQQRLDSLKEEMEEFSRCIIMNEKPEVTGEDGMKAVAIIEAIVKSSETERPVFLKNMYNHE